MESPKPITDTAALTAVCASLREAPYVAVDTEFVRDKTYFAKLCLVQLAYGEHAAVVDPLAPGLDLTPLRELLAAPDVLKVFHSGSQDLEIFLHTFDAIPAPVFDTQIAASVCGHGESVGYGTLVASLLGAEIDKSSQATDWSLRPLSQRQLAYALSDVTHLCDVYERLAAELVSRGRARWIDDELAALTDPRRYRTEPSEAWRRLKIRGGGRRALGIARELAAWRERTAMERDLPRGWVLHDDAIAEIAQTVPRDLEALARVRMIKPPIARGADGRTILEIVHDTLAQKPDAWPELPPRRTSDDTVEPLVALLQALLRLRCDEEGIAPRLVASRDDLEALARNTTPEGPVLTGWRRTLFGDHALALVAGRLALTGGPSGTVTTRVSGDPSSTQGSTER